MSPKRKRPIEDVGGPSTHESADAKPVKVKWDDAKDKLLFSKLILVLHIGEVLKELWEWVASLMGGDKQGFTASTVSQRYNKTLKGGEIIDGKFRSFKEVNILKVQKGSMTEEEKMAHSKMVGGGLQGTKFKDVGVAIRHMFEKGKKATEEDYLREAKEEIEKAKAEGIPVPSVPSEDDFNEESEDEAEDEAEVKEESTLESAD